MLCDPEGRQYLGFLATGDLHKVALVALEKMGWLPVQVLVLSQLQPPTATEAISWPHGWLWHQTD